MKASLAAAFLAILFAGLAQGAPLKDSNYIRVEKPLCKFHYDEELETQALSVLQLKLTSDGARFYDASKPIVTICRKKAILMFSGTLQPEGHYLLDPSNIYIDVEICSHRILTVDHDDGMTVSDTSPCA